MYDIYNWMNNYLTLNKIINSPPVAGVFVQTVQAYASPFIQKFGRRYHKIN